MLLVLFFGNLFLLEVLALIVIGRMLFDASGGDPFWISFWITCAMPMGYYSLHFHVWLYEKIVWWK